MLYEKNMIKKPDDSGIIINSDKSNSLQYYSNSDSQVVFLLKVLFNPNEYTKFINSIMFLLKRIKECEHKENKENEKNQLVMESSILEKHINLSVDIIPGSPQKKLSSSKQKIEEIKYNKLSAETDTNRSSVISVSNSSELQIKDDEMKILQNLKQLFHKFDSCGDTLFSLNNKYAESFAITDNENFINIFFSNLLVYGSYKLKTSTIASNKEVAYKAGTVNYNLKYKIIYQYYTHLYIIYFNLTNDLLLYFNVYLEKNGNTNRKTLQSNKQS